MSFKSALLLKSCVDADSESHKDIGMEGGSEGHFIHPLTIPPRLLVEHILIPPRIVFWGIFFASFASNIFNTFLTFYRYLLRHNGIRFQRNLSSGTT